MLSSSENIVKRFREGGTFLTHTVHLKDFSQLLPGGLVVADGDNKRWRDHSTPWRPVRNHYP